MKFVLCKLCRRPVEDDDSPNFWGVLDGNGKLTQQETPKSPYCEECDGRIRLWDFERQVRAVMKATSAATVLVE